MTKADLVNKVHGNLAFDAPSRRLVEETIDATFTEMRRAIKRDKRLQVPGLGVFKVIHRKARKGVNPQTGLHIKIPANKTVSFRPAPVLKKGL